jgi:hypothetical protein
MTMAAGDAALLTRAPSVLPSTSPVPTSTFPAHSASASMATASTPAPKPWQWLWFIKRFSLLRASPLADIRIVRHCSQDFTCDGQTWRMLLFPSGNRQEPPHPDSDDPLSLYVQRLAGPMQEAALLYRVSFTALLPSDHSRSSSPYAQVTQQTKVFTHRFTSDDNDRGINDWLEAKDLPTYLDDDDDTLTIRVELQRQEVAQRGETGSPARVSERTTDTGFIGLHNHGATCQPPAPHPPTHSLTNASLRSSVLRPISAFNSPCRPPRSPVRACAA